MHPNLLHGRDYDGFLYSFGISDNNPIPLQSAKILLIKNIQKVISMILLIFFLTSIFKKSNDRKQKERKD